MSQEGAQEGEQEAPPKKKGKMLLILGLLLGLGGGGAAGALFLAPMIGERLATPETETAAADDHEEHGEAGGGGGDHEEEPAQVVVHLVDNLVVNPAGSNGNRFLLANVAFETSDENLDDEIAAREFEIRDGLLRVLGLKTVAELTDYSQRESIVAELAAAIEKVLGEGTVIRIYLPQYVIQ